MSLRTIASFAVAIFLGLVAVILLRSVVGSQKAAGPGGVGLTPVVVAGSAIQRGAPLDPKLFKVVNFTSESAPAGSFRAVNQVFPPGQPQRVALRDFAPNEPITDTKISGPGARGNLAGALSPGMRAVGLRSSDVAGVGGFVLPGDRVDILLTRQAGSGEKVSTLTQVLAENARVLAVDQSSDADKPTVAKAVTVEVTPDQAQAISLAQVVGTVSMALRHSADNAPLARRSLSVAELGGAHAPVQARAPKRTVEAVHVYVTRGVAVSEYPISN